MVDNFCFIMYSSHSGIKLAGDTSGSTSSDDSRGWTRGSRPTLKPRYHNPRSLIEGENNIGTSYTLHSYISSHIISSVRPGPRSLRAPPSPARSPVPALPQTPSTPCTRKSVHRSTGKLLRFAPPEARQCESPIAERPAQQGCCILPCCSGLGQLPQHKGT